MYYLLEIIEINRLGPRGKVLITYAKHLVFGPYKLRLTFVSFYLIKGVSQFLEVFTRSWRFVERNVVQAGKQVDSNCELLFRIQDSGLNITSNIATEGLVSCVPKRWKHASHLKRKFVCVNTVVTRREDNKTV